MMKQNNSTSKCSHVDYVVCMNHIKHTLEMESSHVTKTKKKYSKACYEFSNIHKQ